MLKQTAEIPGLPERPLEGTYPVVLRRPLGRLAQGRAWPPLALTSLSTCRQPRALKPLRNTWAIMASRGVCYRRGLRGIGARAWQKLEWGYSTDSPEWKPGHLNLTKEEGSTEEVLPSKHL